MILIDERRVVRAQAQASAGNLAWAVERDIARNIEIIDLSIRTIMSRIQDPDFAQHDPGLQRQLLLDEVATARYFAAIAVTDADAKVLFHSRTVDPSVLQIHTFDYFKVHRDRPDAGLYISLPVKSRHGYGWGLVFSRRLSNPEGSFAGIAYVALSLDYFTDLFQKMDLGSNGSMTVLRTDGRLLARVPFSEEQLGMEAKNAGIYHHFPQRRSGSFEVTSPFDGVPRLVTFTQVGDLPLTVSVARSIESIYVGWQQRVIRIGSVVLVLTGAMIALALNLRRQLRRRHAADQEALRNQALFRGAVKGAGISTALLDLDETVITVNRAYTDLFGYTKEEAVGLTPRQFAFRGDPAPDNGALLRGETDFEEKEYRYRCKDGRDLWVLRSASLIRDEVGRPAFLHVQYQDITARREAEESLRYAATHDVLTGLLNRAAFEDKIAGALTESQETGIKHSLAFLDLDRLKIINDTEGHAAGDAMLQWVATALPAYMRKGDIIGRLGGDEFGIILLGCSIEDATEVLKRLNRAMSAIQFPWGERSFSVGASIGLAEITRDADCPSTILAQADVACMAAKIAGRNRVSIYRPEQSDAVDRHREITVAAGIREAVREGRLELFAQRIVECGAKTHNRYETLVRMKGKDGHTVPSNVFIPAAERYDLIGEVDRWVIRRALGATHEIMEVDPDARVHINLSAASLGDADLCGYILDAIDQAGVPPRMLVFEITETALMSKLAVAEALISKLREIGCQIALDDFGSGLSSFQYLRTFRVDLVKIDGSFVRGMTESVVDQQIVKSIHQIAQELGAQTVAEFIEDDETMKMAAEMGITFVQGYGIHKPEPIERILTRLRESRATEVGRVSVCS